MKYLKTAMQSIETEARVGKFFLTLTFGEKAVEITRPVLSEQFEFDPYQEFKRLDTEGKNSFDEFNIVDFLK